MAHFCSDHYASIYNPLSPSPSSCESVIVSVCVATCRRPSGLKRLLVGLSQLTFGCIGVPDIEIIVVDNDSAGSARALCENMTSRWPIKYDIELQAGICYARNKALANISFETDFIAIIDDDEAPEPCWLEQLMIVQRQYDADVVAGPVLPRFEPKHVPQWVIRGRFFHLPRYRTGQHLDMAFTNNVLVRARLLRSMKPPFDTRFNLTGGEDSHLFMRLYQQGSKIVWADEAVVCEWIPASRMRPHWILRRGYRASSRYSFIERELYPANVTLAMRIAKGVGLIAVGILTLLPALFVGKHATLRALLNTCRGVGTLAGFFGWSLEEYKRSSS